MGFLAKAELSDIPLLRIFFKTIDIEVERDRAEGGAKSYKLSVKALRSGKSLVIFPEGGIHGNPTEVNFFKEGAFRLAFRQKVPILPVGLPDTFKHLPDLQKTGKPGRIHVILHDPIETVGLTDADIPKLMVDIRAMLQKDVDEYENRP
jgi:1-acyl-sn-glycerol-3-phosphate acyltransferase